MPSYKLTYFPLKALGEPIRMLFSYGGVSFVDHRLNWKDWATIKPTTPYGQVPIVEMDGKKVTQSRAICRYLAKQFGLAGKDDLEALEIDSTVDTIYDLRDKSLAHFLEANEVAKADKIEIARKMVPFYVSRLDEQVKNNDSYLVRGRLSWADIAFVGMLDYMNYMEKRDIIEKTKNLQDLKEKVLNEPKIKNWVANRPTSVF